MHVFDVWALSLVETDVFVLCARRWVKTIQNHSKPTHDDHPLGDVHPQGMVWSASGRSFARPGHRLQVLLFEKGWKGPMAYVSHVCDLGRNI